MKRKLKRVFNRLVGSAMNEFELERGQTLSQDEVVAQKTLMQYYRMNATLHPNVRPRWEDIGFRKYSQFEEDGILLYLFSVISPINRTSVEICAGTGRECMTTNLIVNHGWWGHLFDGNEANVAAGKRFFANNKSTFLHPPRFTQAWITAENVNDHIARSGAEGPIDLLSLDIDGMDYWVWKAINVIEPQVVVCEIHNLIPADQALTVPYDPKFVCASEQYRGASLAAMCKLGREKGYRLVGTHRYGFNAFFVKNGVGENFLPEVEPASCATDPYTIKVQQDHWPAIQSMPWQQV